MNRRKHCCIFLLLCVVLAGCGLTPSTQVQEKQNLETGFIPARPGMYDSVDTAVIVNVNKTACEITFFNTIVEKNYTLIYDGTCNITNKYGDSLSIDQIHAGEIVDVAFLKEKKKLASIHESAEAFSFENVSRYAIDEKKKEIRIGNSIYQYEDELLILSQGEKMDLMDIHEVDKLSLRGLGNTIYSISIDEGHGYLRVKNEEALVGGWLEIGQSIIQKITEGMLVVVPEGSYEVLVSANGVSELKKVQIKRDKETELDLGGIKKTEKEKTYGNLIFAITPETASVYIDGEYVDTSIPYQVEYGVHQMMVKAEGYQTIIQYIKVGQENATISVTMEKQTDNSVSSNTINNTVSSNTTSTTSGGTLTISAPTGAELYVDGNYVGIVPASIKKTYGVHVVVLRKDGYDTRSYTINITDTESDESMSFSNLIKTAEKKSEDDDDDDDDKDDDEDDDEKDEKKDGSVSGNDG